jgi:hypothetical protein
MISVPTVFILGAGSSMPYGFPSGKALSDMIWQASPDAARYGIDPDAYKTFASALRACKQSSVDAFLEHRQEFLDVGKKAIALYLIRRETNDALFGAEDVEDWYKWVVDRMTADVSFDELVAKNKIGFVTFNYDRSLEHFMFTTISARYGRRFEEVAKVINQFKFIHVHGRLGFLPWQNQSQPDNQRNYDSGCEARDVRIAANGIKIISENMDSSPDFTEAQDLMGMAERIAILGFGFHPTNMRRLNVPFRDDRHVFGTCKGITEAETVGLKHRCKGLQLRDQPSLTLLRNISQFQD